MIGTEPSANTYQTGAGQRSPNVKPLTVIKNRIMNAADRITSAGNNVHSVTSRLIGDIPQCGKIEDAEKTEMPGEYGALSDAMDHLESVVDLLIAKIDRQLNDI